MPTLECVKGDISQQADLQALVNAANAQLLPGAGVAGAIHRAAGPGLAEECRGLAPIKPGQAVITTGHQLPNPWVIHCLGPVYGVDEPAAELLAACYRNALLLAEERGITSLAFPAISTGSFGYPPREAAKVCVEELSRILPQLRQVKLVRLVLLQDGDYQIVEQLLAQSQLRQGRRYAVSQQRGKAKGKVRYVETNDPGKGCRFL